MKTITQNLLSYVVNRAFYLTSLLALFGCQSVAIASELNSKSKFTIETNRVWINVTDTQGAFSQTLMGYRTGATDGIDYGLDGAYMNDGAVALASLIGNARYAIQFKGLPFNPNDIVPLSFSASYNGTYTFVIDHKDGFFNNPAFAVYLHDTLTNTYTNLKTGGYTFTANTGMYNNRFELTYSVPLTSLGVNQNAFTAANLVVYQNNADLIINSGPTPLKTIALYSISGQLLYQNNQANATETIITNANYKQQPIIIKVTTQEDVTVSKKWVSL